MICLLVLDENNWKKMINLCYKLIYRNPFIFILCDKDMDNTLIEDTTRTKKYFFLYVLSIMFFALCSLHNIDASNQIYTQNHGIDNCSSNSQCTSSVSSSGSISSGQNSVSYSTIIANTCNSGSSCTTESENNLQIISSQANSQSSLISQTTDFNNICTSSICSNILQNDATINNSYNNKIIQTGFQENKCSSNSECFIVGSLSGSINEDAVENKAFTQSLSQENYCFYNSKCSIEGGIVQTGGTSTQTNLCMLGSDCTNTHANSQLIAIGTVCSSDGSAGIKICTPFGIFSVPNFRSDPTQQNYQYSAFEQTAFAKQPIDDNEDIQAALEEQYVVNDPGFTNPDKTKDVVEDQETLVSDQIKSTSIDPSLSSKINEQTQNLATKSVRPKISTEFFNVFDSFENNILQGNQGMHYESIIPQIPTSQEIQSHNTMTNMVGNAYSLGLLPSSEDIQKTLHKFLSSDSNKATLSKNIETNTQNTFTLVNPISLSASSSLQPTSNNPGLYHIPSTASLLQPININHGVYLSQHSLDDTKSIQNILNSLLLGKEIG